MVLTPARAASGALFFGVFNPGFSMAAPSSPTAIGRRASGTDGVDGFGVCCLRWKERRRGVIWMGIVSDEQELIPTVGF